MTEPVTDPTTGSTTYWCEQAWLGGEAAESGVTIEVEGDRITNVRPGVASPPPGAVRLDGLTLPALANAHSHAFHRALRGRTHQRRGDFWSWRELMYGVADGLTPATYLDLARATFAEMALAGIGVVGEFHYVHHRRDGTEHDDPNAMGAALVAAAAAAGIRLTLLDTAYLRGGFADPPDATTHGPLRDEQRRFGDGDASAWTRRVDALHDCVAGPTVRVGAAIHSVRAADPATMETVAAHTEDYDAPLHVHASEQPAENEQCLERFGVTPVELLGRHGVLGPRATVVHATHVTPADIELLATTGSGCCLCPTTERDLADGIGPGRDLAGAGVPISLGSDSHAIVDLFEEAREVELHERLVTGERGGHRPDELIEMATGHGHRALGWPEGGRIGPGALADFTTVRLDSVRLAGISAATTLPAVVYAATAADVDHLVVGGRTVVSEGRHATIDVADALRTAVTAVAGS